MEESPLPQGEMSDKYPGIPGSKTKFMVRVQPVEESITIV